MRLLLGDPPSDKLPARLERPLDTPTVRGQIQGRNMGGVVALESDLVHRLDQPEYLRDTSCIPG